MFFNLSGKIFREHNLFSVNKIIFAAFLLMSAAALGSAQEIPCLDLRSDQVKFFKLSRSSPKTTCRNALKTSGARENLGDITISGRVTHQNGVRMSGVTMTLVDKTGGGARTVVTDPDGFYQFNNLAIGSYQLTPSRENYTFFPPSVIWDGIVEDAVQNFIAAGPPPEEPPPPPGTPTLAWSQFYDGAAHSADFNAMLGRDAAGNTYLGGTTYIDEVTGDTDIVLSKIDVNGNLVWSKTFNGSGNYKDGLVDMAVDAGGNASLTGYSYSTPTGGGNLNSYDYLTLKYDADGNLLWSKTYAKTNGYDDFPNSLKIDAAGNVYVTGYSWDENVFADFATVKYAANGNQIWAKRFSTAQGDAGNEVEVDAAGNVYVTGISQNGPQGGSEDVFTVKYDPAGNQLWTNRYNSPVNDSDEGFEVEVDAGGDVYVLGVVRDLGNPTETFIQKINGATGANIWTKTYLVPNSFDGSIPTAMALDGDGNIVIAGMTSLSDKFYNVDIFTAKFDSSGVNQWVKTYDGPADDDYDGDTKLLLDAAGNIYAGATSEGFANADLQIFKYSPDGAEIWRYRYGSPFFDYDLFLDWEADVSQTTMLLDGDGNLYVAGNSFIPEQATNLFAFKLEPVAGLRAAPFDFDGDQKADIAVFRPETGVWYIHKSSDGTYAIVKWGLENDKLVPADYDGDGKNDLAVYRDGVWYIVKSSDGTFLFNQFGLTNDKPIPSDFDNDGRADLSVFRQGVWHQLTTSNNSYKAFQFGLSSDTPLPSDYDHNRRSDVAVYRGGSWYVSFQAELPLSLFQFGVNTDRPVPADYDGDGQTDYSVFRDGVWYIRQSRTNSYAVVQWGQTSDVPVPADYDGDKKSDLAVYRGGVWYILRSSDNAYTITQFGLANDIPIPAAFSR
jgi:(2Fe-2S) ferredoxin